MKKLIHIFIPLFILLVFVSCSQQPKKDIQSFIENTFGYKSVESVNKTVPPILGGKFNYYVSFTDKSDNECF